MKINRDEIVSWVLRRYRRVQNYQYEVGLPLWKRKKFLVCGRLVCGRLIHSEDYLSVKPYSKSIPKILKFYKGELNSNWSFLGDYHTHIGETQSWVSQFPSAADLVAPSVLGDYWPMGGNSLDIVPQIQIVHSMVDGDFFLLVPNKERNKYSSVTDQQNDIQRICCEYQMHYMIIESKYGDIEDSDGTLTNIVRKEISKINDIIGKRAIMHFYSRREERWIC